MTEFPCPHCQITLRIRDDSFRNRVIPCPECRKEVLIKDQNGQLVGFVPPTETARELASGLGKRKNVSAPKLIAGGVALLLLGGIVYLSLDHQEKPGLDVSNVPQSETAAEQLSPPLEALPAAAPAPVSEPEKIIKKDPPDVERMNVIGTMIKEEIQRNEEFPNSKNEQKSSGWSWLATLAERHLPANATRHREAGWDAPVNDEFVRRTFPQFLNPAVPQKAGEDHYPTTHYIGVTGVSVDAAKKEGLNPSGYFGGGLSKRTEVPDGLSNMMMVAGVSNQLGSWARPGTATERAFSQEPYINGPDGFGTGQADGMYVLMADGSVRFLNQNTDPAVIRQLATIQRDNSQSMTKKADTPPPETAPVTPKSAPENPLPADAPIGVAMVPDVPKIDLSKRLAQKLVRFELKEPASLEILLFDLQELVGVPFDLSELPMETRKKTIKLTLQEPTVFDVLKEVARAADVGYVVQREHISVRRGYIEPESQNK